MADAGRLSVTWVGAMEGGGTLAHIPRRGDEVEFEDGSRYRVSDVRWRIDDDEVVIEVETS